MVLCPEAKSAPRGGVVSAWEAVASTQKRKSAKYMLVRQPDHARLSGQIAERFAIPDAPPVDDDVVRGISLHDEGWSSFDDGSQRLSATTATYSGENVPLSAEGKPLSFLEIKAGDFLRAWNGSIEAAEAVAPIAGLIVSGHFCRLGNFGINSGTYSNEDTQRVREFLAREEQRERCLIRLQNRSKKEVEYWTDVLQFCDLLSLYLCCGSEESVEFPQHIGSKSETIRLQVEDGVHVLSPAIFAGEAEFSLQAYPHPAEAAQIQMKLTWRVR
jgi:Protein of unknown function (DUF3891)